MHTDELPARQRPDDPNGPGDPRGWGPVATGRRPRFASVARSVLGTIGQVVLLVVLLALLAWLWGDGVG